MTKPILSSHVLWLQVWGLAAVQGAIALTWVIYNLYLIQLLTEFGFARWLATGLLIIENILAAVMEPLMGSFSDRTQRWIGTRFPLIAAGIVLSAICFIAIPMVVAFGVDAGPARWLLPGMMALWALAMTVFRSPALSMLGRYAIETKLPQAASILTIVGGVAGAMGPLAGPLILNMGPLVAFTIGSLVLVTAALTLRSVNPNRAVLSAMAQGSTPFSGRQRVSVAALGWVLGAGIGVALGFRLLMQNFPKILAAQGLQGSTGLILGAIFVSLALTAIPAGWLAAQIGNRMAMTAGLGLMGGLCALAMVSQGGAAAALIAIAIGAVFSLVSNGTLPFALSLVPPDKGGLGTGMYFSGGAIANTLFGFFFAAETLSPSVAGLMGAIAFWLAGLCIMASNGADRESSRLWVKR